MAAPVTTKTHSYGKRSHLPVPRDFAADEG